MSQSSTIRFPARPLESSFQPQSIESSLYQFWEQSRCFETSDRNASGQTSFAIMIPPPNVTGALHMGHALGTTLQDALVRWRRMKGDNALWLPGTDHAGIATQAQVEKAIAQEGKGPTGKPQTRHDLGREAFLKRTWQWKEQYEGRIKDQLRKMGSSLDWKRERFTLDEGLSAAVREVFTKLYQDGQIYRGNRIINWCPRCQTALSDLEVNPKERKGSIWKIKYRVEGASPDSENELIVATTRPETLLGDTAVAVHPEDERFQKFKGKRVSVPLTQRSVPVLMDEYVDREFGTGALKITPAHDFNDYELGKKHQLPTLIVMGKDGRMTAEAGPYAGLKYAEAREKILVDLEAAGLLVSREDHTNKVGLCQRCDTVAEPLISLQWWVNTAKLAAPALEAVRSGEVKILPQVWEKTYFDWMENIRDWCISRQLWWGHQIPAWYCPEEHVTVSAQTPQKCAQCGSAKLTQDEDVLDTWFSSALWPFSTLGWPEKTQAFQTFYPNTVIETGFDILFFWVARMMMMGLYFTGKAPFSKILLHAMVRDEKGEKMSKSKGNVIDPLDLIEKHGTDALRFTLASMAGQGRDIKLSEDRVEGYRAFANKLWNAVKFFHLQCADLESQEGLDVERWLVQNHAELLPANRWILSQLQDLIPKVEAGFENYLLSESAQALYEFVWKEFCDWYIEFSKLALREGGSSKLQTVYTLRYGLEVILKLLHPLMPFVTEELWQSLPWKKAAQTLTRDQLGLPPIETLMLSSYPVVRSEFVDRDSEKTIWALRAIVEAVRNFRGENNLSPKVEFEIQYLPLGQAPAALIDAFMRMHDELLKNMTKVKAFHRVETGKAAKESEAILLLQSPPLEMRVELSGLVDVDGEVKRVQKNLEKLNADIEFVNQKLAKPSFREKAPPELVQAEEKKREEYSLKKRELEASLQRLQNLRGK